MCVCVCVCACVYNIYIYIYSILVSGSECQKKRFEYRDSIVIGSLNNWTSNPVNPFNRVNCFPICEATDSCSAAISYTRKVTRVETCVHISGVEPDKIRVTKRAGFYTVIFEVECNSKYRLYGPT